jgi:hypothetical protein
MHVCRVQRGPCWWSDVAAGGVGEGQDSVGVCSALLHVNISYTGDTSRP